MVKCIGQESGEKNGLGTDKFDVELTPFLKFVCVYIHILWNILNKYQKQLFEFGNMSYKELKKLG